MGRIRHVEGNGDEVVEVSEERIIAILRDHEAGLKTGNVCRKQGVRSATFYKWKAKYSGFDVSKALRLKVLTDENALKIQNAGLDDRISKSRTEKEAE